MARPLCRGKVRYTEAQAEAEALSRRERRALTFGYINSYLCRRCGWHHVGRGRFTGREKAMGHQEGGGMQLTEEQKQRLQLIQRKARLVCQEAERRHQNGTPLEVLEREVLEAQDV